MTGEPLSTEQALAAAQLAGVHPLSISTPFVVGRVNLYLLEDEPLTLVDTGPSSGKALEEVEAGFAELGHTIDELGLIVLTHQHIDHAGLADALARRSGAEVAAFHELTGYLGDFRRSAELDDDFAVALMLRHGIPRDVAQALRAVSAAFRSSGGDATITRPLHDGDTLALRDRTLAVLHRPGHSPSDVVLWDELRRIAIGGDHLLKHIGSNPLIARPLGHEGDRRPQSLRSYRASLSRTRELDARMILTGHGDPVTDHRTLIDERFGLSERRAGKLLRLLEDAPLTAHELAQRMWGNVAVTHAYLTLSEVLGHLDLLSADGRARERADGDVARFEAVV